jgi:hypothetical protein
VYPLAVRSAQAPWSVRPPAEAWSVDRCVAGCRPEARLREACQRAVSLSERPSAASDARALQAEAAAVAVVCASAQQPAEAAVPLAQPVAVAEERASAVAEEVPHAAAVPLAQPVAVAEERASAVAEEVPHAAEEPASLRAVAVAEAAEEPASLRVEAVAAAAQLAVRAAGARPSAAPSAFHPGRVLPWPAPPRAARFAHAMQCSQIAPPTARWWPAARGEVSSW